VLSSVRIAVVVLLLGRPALADRLEGALDLQWQAAAGCPDRGAAASAIAELIGETAAHPRVRAPASVRVAIARTSAGGFVARLSTSSAGQNGERELEGEDCGRVADAVVLIVAMMLDPVTAADRVNKTPADEDHLRFSIGALGAVDAGSLPAPSAGAGVGLGLHLAPFHGHVEGLAWIPRLALKGPVAGSGGEIGLYTGALRACWDVFRDTAGELSLGPCAGAELGLSTGRGLNISHPARSSGLWSAATLAIRMQLVGRSGFAFGFSVEGGAALHRPAYFIENYGEVFRASPVFGRAKMDMAWIFP
jgi:hypothetical protein